MKKLTCLVIICLALFTAPRALAQSLPTKFNTIAPDVLAAGTGVPLTWQDIGSDVHISGNTGIGTTTPSSALEVVANSTTWAGWNEAIRLGPSNHAAITHPGSGLLFGFHSNGNFYWGKSGTYSMYLDPLGDLTAYGTFLSGGNIINSGPSNGWLGLTGDLPGYTTGIYPTLKTNGSYLYFSIAGDYSGYFGDLGIAARNFYDFDNGNYYLKPSATSNVNTVTVNGSLCLGGVCKSAWDITTTPTLQSVTNAGSTTTNTIYAQGGINNNGGTLSLGASNNYVYTNAVGYSSREIYPGNPNWSGQLSYYLAGNYQGYGLYSNTSLYAAGGLYAPVMEVGQAYLSSGGNYVHLATNEWYNGSSWQANGTPGGLFQIAGSNFNWYYHNGAGSHTTLASLDSNGNFTIDGQNLYLNNSNPYIYSASSYITIPNGLYISGGTLYAQNTIQARGGVNNDNGGNLNLTSNNGVVYANANYFKTSGWFDNINAGQGLYNESTGTHWYSTNNYYWQSSAPAGIVIRNGYEGTIQGYLYSDRAGSFGLLNGGGGWGVQLTGSGVNTYGTTTVIGGGIYGNGGLRLGNQMLSGGNNNWIYEGDSSGNLYNGQGLAAANLYAANILYAAGGYLQIGSGQYTKQFVNCNNDQWLRLLDSNGSYNNFGIAASYISAGQNVYAGQVVYAAGQHINDRFGGTVGTMISQYLNNAGGDPNNANACTNGLSQGLYTGINGTCNQVFSLVMERIHLYSGGFIDEVNGYKGYNEYNIVCANGVTTNITSDPSTWCVAGVGVGQYNINGTGQYTSNTQYLRL